MSEEKLELLATEIKEREFLLSKFSGNDHWLYEMQKKMLDDKKREYEFIKKEIELKYKLGYVGSF